MAEWRVLEPAWRTFFLRTQLSRTFKVHMRLVPCKVQHGQMRTVQKSWTLGKNEDGSREEPFSFDSDALETPLQNVVLKLGWTWRGVITGKL